MGGRQGSFKNITNNICCFVSLQLSNGIILTAPLTSAFFPSRWFILSYYWNSYDLPQIPWDRLLFTGSWPKWAQRSAALCMHTPGGLTPLFLCCFVMREVSLCFAVFLPAVQRELVSFCLTSPPWTCSSLKLTLHQTFGSRVDSDVTKPLLKHLPLGRDPFLRTACEDF